MALSQRFVSRLLGHRDATVVSRYERGRLIPPLQTALRLELIYRVPVAFLFPALYEALRTEVRSAEQQLVPANQLALL